jgi:hypothetical protein
MHGKTRHGTGQCHRAAHGLAAQRHVIVNGQRINAAEIRYLDRLRCSHIPDGRYWLNTRTGIWGYQSGGAQGYISDNCNARRPGLSKGVCSTVRANCTDDSGARRIPRGVGGRLVKRLHWA